MNFDASSGFEVSVSYKYQKMANLFSRAWKVASHDCCQSGKAAIGERCFFSGNSPNW